MRLLPALALSASLALGACQHPDGSTDWGGTLALGGGVAALTGLALLAANSNDDGRHYRQRRDWRRHGGYRHEDRYAWGARESYRSRW